MNTGLKMDKAIDAYSARRVGTTGCEIVGPEGVIAWTIDDYWASIIVALLNRTENEGLTATSCDQPTPPH